MSEDTTTKRRLGRGLSALLGGEEQGYTESNEAGGAKLVPVELLEAGRFQPRRNFNDAEMASLVASVREKGILQPILVRRHPDDASKYEIVAGERRWRAAQVAQLHVVPVVIKEFGNRDVLEIALVENLQREDLGPLEEAAAYQRLIKEFSHLQGDAAKAVGKSRSHVANTLRLLELHDDVKLLLDKGDLTAGHARALLKCKDQVAAAKAVVAKGLNVRQTEQLCRDAELRPGATHNKVRDVGLGAKDTDTLALERDLANVLGLKVSIQCEGEGGSITIHYKTLEQFDDVLGRLNQSPSITNSSRDTALRPSDSASPGARALAEEEGIFGSGAQDDAEDILVLDQKTLAMDGSVADGEVGSVGSGAEGMITNRPERP